MLLPTFILASVEHYHSTLGWTIRRFHVAFVTMAHYDDSYILLWLWDLIVTSQKRHEALLGVGVSTLLQDAKAIG